VERIPVPNDDTLGAIISMVLTNEFLNLAPIVYRVRIFSQCGSEKELPVSRSFNRKSLVMPLIDEQKKKQKKSDGEFCNRIKHLD
jgi:hypothetical protein